jgi:O-antigen/teichoic acid export membrane protein
LSGTRRRRRTVIEPQRPAGLLPSPAATIRVVRNGLALGGSKVATSLVLFAWQVALARQLGVAGYGVYAVLGAALALAAVVPELGLGLVVARDAAKRPETAPSLLAATLVIQPCLATMAMMCVVALAWRAPSVAGLGLLLVVAAAPLVTDTLGNLCHAQLVAAERLVAPSAIALLHASVLVSVGAPLVWSGFGLGGVYGAILAASTVRAVVYMRRLAVVGIVPAWPVSRSSITRLLVQGWPIALLALVGMARLNADKLLVTPILGVAATGQLQAAFVIVFGLGDVLNASLLTTLLPAMARSFHSGRRDRFDYVVERLALAGLVVGVPIASAGFLFAERGCGLLFGSRYAETPRLLAVLLVALAVTMTSNAFQQVLIVEGRQRALLVARTAILGVLLVVLFVLVPRIGLIGAAVASLVTEIGGLVALVLLARPPATSVRRLTKNGLALTLVAACATALAHVVDPAAGALAALVMGATYVAGVVASRVVSAAEWQLLLDTLGLLRRRREA